MNYNEYKQWNKGTAECTKTVQLRDTEEYFIKLDINEITRLVSHKWEQRKEGEASSYSNNICETV